jgi:ParB-like chromosome segregation protein Spo0J
MKKDIIDLTEKICESISSISDNHEKIDLINQIRFLIHKVSPLKHHPVDYVYWESSENLESNDYNPNAVAPPEQKLLEESIVNDGYTMPIVTYKDGFEDSFMNVINGMDISDDEKREIVDGFHRRKSERSNPLISESTMGYLPVTNIRNEQRQKSDRMASTIRHNRARGTHNIELMSTIVSELVEMGKGDAWICKHIGMSKDELLRLKQITGLASLFQNEEFTNSWESDIDNVPIEQLNEVDG